jgi:hypothetical protein
VAKSRLGGFWGSMEAVFRWSHRRISQNNFRSNNSILAQHENVARVDDGMRLVTHSAGARDI